MRDCGCPNARHERRRIAGPPAQPRIPCALHFFTAFPDEKIRAQALAAGAICHLTKPFDEESLIQGLQAAVKKHDGGSSK
jgi:CheY-like chemotaxis protein